MFKNPNYRYLVVLSVLCVLIVVDLTVLLNFFVLPYIHDGRSGIRAKIVGSDEQLYEFYVNNLEIDVDEQSRTFTYHIAWIYERWMLICIGLCLSTYLFVRWEKRLRGARRSIDT